MPDAHDRNSVKAWTLLTALDEIKGHEEHIGRARPTGEAYARDFRGPNWLDLRKAAAAYAEPSEETRIPPEPAPVAEISPQFTPATPENVDAPTPTPSELAPVVLTELQVTPTLSKPPAPMPTEPAPLVETSPT